MLVKSVKEDSHLDDLQEMFDTLCHYDMKLNPSKCAFGVSLGKFLGFMVLQRSIEANPDKSWGHIRNYTTEERQGGTKPEWQDCGSQ